jgi:hypothetical protein
MLPPIEKQVRRAVISMSIALAASGLLVVPLAGSSSAYVSDSEPRFAVKPANVRRDDPWRARTVSVARDPFLSVAAPAGPIASGPPSASRSLIGMRVIQGQTITPASAAAAVRAIALGREPKAMIEIDGSTRIVAPGDFISGARVESILADRVILSGGMVLRFPRKSP